MLQLKKPYRFLFIGLLNISLSKQKKQAILWYREREG